MCFSVQSFGDLSPYVCSLYNVLLLRFWLLSGHLLGNNCALGWPFVLIVISILFISHFGFKSECHHNARARGNQAGFRRCQLVDRQKRKFVVTLLRFFSLRNKLSN